MENGGEFIVGQSRSRLNRPRIDATLGVTEMRRFDGQSLSVELLSGDVRHERIDVSLSVPFLPVGELAIFLHQVKHDGEFPTLQAFVQRVRGQALPPFAWPRTLVRLRLISY
jgi:hypothetical protein